jgi:DNA-binding NarL/FixJ family response regulator
VLHRKHYTALDPSVSMLLASRIPGAKFVLVDGSWNDIRADDEDPAIAEMDHFLEEASEENGHVDSSWAEEAPAGRHLTARERELLTLLTAGMHNAEIATKLDVSIHTVERHLANIYTKIGARSRVEAAAYALRHGLAT